MRRRRNWLLLAVTAMATAVAVTVTFAVATRGPRRGEPTPGAVVEAYLDALTAHDLARLVRLDRTGDAATSPARERLRRYGSGRLQVTRTAVNSTESNAMKSATLTGTLDGAPYSGTIWLQRWDGRWYVLLASGLSTPWPHR